jgi:hypothetical protein
VDWEWDAAEAVEAVRGGCARVGRNPGAGLGGGVDGGAGAGAGEDVGPVRPLALQGNLDPTALHAPRRALVYEVRRVLRGFGSMPLIGNLGHGMSPSHTPRQLAVFFDAVHAISARMRDGGPGKPLRDVTDAEVDALLDAEGELGRMVAPEGAPM